MNQFELIATTTFGLEAVVKKEIINLGYEIVKSENGKITFLSDLAGIAKANLWLRTADRVLLKLGEFHVETFDELFNQTIEIEWENFIPVDGKFTVNGKSVKSKLFSISDCQAIVKKSIVERLKKKYNVEWFLETGAEYTVLVSVLNDVATITIDTSGQGLHKRGYRIKAVEAPIKETLAAALILLSYWNKERTIYDVFCGSGTIPIEAALIGKNIAPGLKRDFASKHWDFIGKEIWEKEIEKAENAIDKDIKLSIFASDIDALAMEATTVNAIEAGVGDCIQFCTSDFKDIKYKEEYGVLISNPPYGQRLLDDKDVVTLYNNLKSVLSKLETWSFYILTSIDNFAKLINKKPDRERKLYNGNIEVRYFQYYGPRPPKKE